jgi:cation diffusion facilitator CzcD-associated flavoprotein CzcO
MDLNSIYILTRIQFSYKEMHRKLNGDSRLVDKIIPKDFNVGCRRPTPGNGYLEALVGEKTTTFTETISCITPTGFKDHAGQEYECDVIICATGFDTSFRPRFPVVGLNGVSLAKRWEKVPESYMGIAAPSMPNYFMFTGPFTPVAQGAILPILTSMSNYFLKVRCHSDNLSTRDIQGSLFIILRSSRKCTNNIFAG